MHTVSTKDSVGASDDKARSGTWSTAATMLQDAKPPRIPEGLPPTRSAQPEADALRGRAEEA
ncbi:hypothetical protein GCM10010121_052630 [Streptomyces brasiliensis]|uniref:Uncharacterized protein n=1 Tax=Streptomyces brasiliensis TaxID=1954 RepID=A0A917KXP2_9ACTN|nr:hypothetical protein GCM10010121_052630 [Streptomyces brasiliensis]